MPICANSDLPQHSKQTDNPNHNYHSDAGPKARIAFFQFNLVQSAQFLQSERETPTNTYTDQPQLGT